MNNLWGAIIRVDWFHCASFNLRLCRSCFKFQRDIFVGCNSQFVWFWGNMFFLVCCLLGKAERAVYVVESFGKEMSQHLNFKQITGADFVHKDILWEKNHVTFITSRLIKSNKLFNITMNRIKLFAANLFMVKLLN